MQTNSTRKTSPPLGQRRKRSLLIALTLGMLLLIWPTESGGESAVNVDGPGKVSTITMERATWDSALAEIDTLEAEVVMLEGELAATNVRWRRVVALKDQHILVLKDIIADAQPSTWDEIRDKILWTSLGYTLKSLDE